MCILKTKEVSVIEVHPASTRKALSMLVKDLRKIQTFLKQIGLDEDVEKHILTPYEIDTVSAVLTTYLHLHRRTIEVGNKKEGRIVIPKKLLRE